MNSHNLKVMFASTKKQDNPVVSHVRYRIPDKTGPFGCKGIFSPSFT